MKKILLLLSLLIFIAQVHAVDIPASTSGATYSGKIEGVAIGFFDHVGIGLPAGDTCNGRKSLALLTTHPQYKEIMSVLLAAEASGKIVKFYGLGSEISTFGSGYCVVNWASLGNFPLW